MIWLSPRKEITRVGRDLRKKYTIINNGILRIRKLEPKRRLKRKIS
jgi:hypothetical protein